MTDEELIAEMRRIGTVLRRRIDDVDRLAAGLLNEAADRLEGRPAAQAAEDSHG